MFFVKSDNFLGSNRLQRYSLCANYANFIFIILHISPILCRV